MKKGKKNESRRILPPHKKENNAGYVKHDRYGKFYRDKFDEDKFYTKDIDKHGGSQWKEYREQGRYMEWQGDLDEFGIDIKPKHKSAASKNIPLKEFFGGRK